jgi:Uma2 family endonuclease
MTAPLVTAAELSLPHMPEHAELVRGVLVVREPSGFRHAEITARLTMLLGTYVAEQGLGRVVSGDAGFQLSSAPDTVRGADVAFVRGDRVPEPAPVGFASFPPDLAVEILSPGDRPGDTLAKVADWLTAGTQLVWVIDPFRRVARISYKDGTEFVIGERDVLDGDDVVPGFRCQLAKLL